MIISFTWSWKWRKTRRELLAEWEAEEAIRRTEELKKFDSEEDDITALNNLKEILAIEQRFKNLFEEKGWTGDHLLSGSSPVSVSSFCFTDPRLLFADTERLDTNAFLVLISDHEAWYMFKNEACKHLNVSDTTAEHTSDPPRPYALSFWFALLVLALASIMTFTGGHEAAKGATEFFSKP